MSDVIDGRNLPPAASIRTASPGQSYDTPGGPSQKIQAVGLGGVVVTIIIWLWAILQRSVEGLPEMPPEVAAALATIVAALAGYLQRDRRPS